MKIRVLLFAGLREKIGKSEVLIELPSGCLVSNLQEQLGIEKSLWSSMAFALNQTYVSVQAPLKEGDEVAIIPPVAGG